MLLRDWLDPIVAAVIAGLMVLAVTAILLKLFNRNKRDKDEQ